MDAGPYNKAANPCELEFKNTTKGDNNLWVSNRQILKLYC